jgi:hypothetical protein
MLISDSDMMRKPTNIEISESNIRLSFSDGSLVMTPLNLFPRLMNATDEQRKNWSWIGGREGFHWPDVDEDIAVRTLVRESRLTEESFVQVPVLLADLFRISEDLGKLFHDRSFTLDGHLVGSIGEVVARYIYDLVLAEGSTPQVDGRTRQGKTVQVKLTGPTGRAFGIRWNSAQNRPPPELLVCLKLTEKGFEEIYAGRFPVELLAGRKEPSNGQLSVSVSKLQAMHVHEVPQRNLLTEFNMLFNREFDKAA